MKYCEVAWIGAGKFTASIDALVDPKRPDLPAGASYKTVGGKDVCRVIVADAVDTSGSTKSYTKAEAEAAWGVTIK